MKIFGWIVGILVVIVVIFNISKKLLCTHDKKVKEVALPLATVIVKHIEKNGVPDSLKDIKEIPYDLKNCEKSTYKEDRHDFIQFEDKERCDFKIENKKYVLRIKYAYDDQNTYRNIYI